LKTNIKPRFLRQNRQKFQRKTKIENTVRENTAMFLLGLNGEQGRGLSLNCSNPGKQTPSVRAGRKRSKTRWHYIIDDEFKTFKKDFTEYFKSVLE